MCSLQYARAHDFSTDLCMDLLITPPHLRDQCCAKCTPSGDDGPHRWDGDFAPDGVTPSGRARRAQPGGLHYIQCPHGLLSQSRTGCLHNAVQQVAAEMAREAFGARAVSSTFGSNAGSESHMYSPHHAADIFVRNAGERGVPWHIEVATFAPEGGAASARATATAALHVATVRKRAIASYRGLQGLTGDLCVFAVDTRGGLGPGAFVPAGDGGDGRSVRVWGASDFLRLCATRRHPPGRPGAEAARAVSLR